MWFIAVRDLYMPDEMVDYGTRCAQVALEKAAQLCDIWDRGYYHDKPTCAGKIREFAETQRSSESDK